MCGINGIYGLRDEFRVRDLLVHMNSKLSHRGPDAQGIWTRGGIGLGHRRLSIIDLSEEARQPMVNNSVSVCISYNGEIYNFRELKKLCAGYEFKTESDTEVLLAMYEKFGRDMFQMLDGMFALALWDENAKKLLLARDRVGKKPLYYSWEKGILVFSSEIRGILASKLISPKLSRNMFSQYLQFQTVYSPNTIVENVKMVPAGSYAVVSEGIMDFKKFWSIDRAKEKFALTGPYDKVVKQTRDLFFKSVEKRMISDVPLGAFLSGGVDSSCVVAAMTSVSSNRIKTFNMCFEDEEFSEKKYAEIIAKKFNTEHHSVEIKPEDLLAELPEFLKSMDHPGLDGLNTFVVSKYTKQTGITVALSGIGGDEFFGGYPVFKYIKQINRWRKLGVLPTIVRRNLVRILKRRYSENQIKRLLQIAELPNWNLNTLYPVFRMVYSASEMKQLGVAPQALNCIEMDNDNQQKIMSEISISESKTYLENVLLRDTDQMSMAHSLEVRAPFLDKDLIEFVLSLPDDFKPIQPPKKLIIDAMGELLPKETWDRKKMGFTLPWKKWMNTDLKPFCEENLEYLLQLNLINHGYLQKLLNSLNDEINESWFEVWNLVILTDWLRRNEIKIE